MKDRLKLLCLLITLGLVELSVVLALIYEELLKLEII
jgi:hypothetical protein